jgi:hypothetical protein
MRTAVDEAISIRYMLRCLGVPVTQPTELHGDNFGVIQSAEIPEGELKKKLSLLYHTTKSMRQLRRELSTHMGVSHPKIFRHKYESAGGEYLS